MLDNQELLVTFFEGARDLIIFIDNDRIIRQVSPKSLHQIMGYKAEEVIGESVKIFYAFEEDFVRLGNKYYHTGATTPEEPYECRYKRKSGEIFWVEILPSVVQDSKGSAVGWMSIIRDATQRKKSEEESKKLQSQFYQSQKMDALGRLTGGVAHDFNNLLTAMIGHVELVRMKVKPDSPLIPHVDEISRAADRASKLTRQLLTFSRSQVVVPRVLHLNMIVEESRKLLSRLIQENIEIKTKLSSSGSRVRVDVGQVEQILVNLAINAQDAMLSGGELIISTRDLELNNAKRFMEMELAPGRYVLLSVTDTGTGMPREVLEHLFEPFFTTKEPGKGTGLGLATVYGIVKQMGGAIDVSSTVGEGSTFSIYFPVVEGRTDQEEFQPARVPESGHETVFLVEDEPVIRNLNQQILTSKGYKVLTASNGIEALEKAKTHRAGKIDLLVIDVVMPKMDGYQAALKICELFPDMRVLYVSGYTKDVTMEHGVQGSGLNFMQKPFTPDQLLHRVREILDSKTPARA
jgi:PAS domain S-box-containing protein